MLRRWLLGFVFLASCSRGAREVELRFQGHPAPGAYAEDTRAIVEICPACQQAAARSSPHSCGARLRFPDRATCGFCRGTKACAVCSAFETSGLCRFCSGAGKRGAESCFGCRGSGACAACAGSAACDACGETGSISPQWIRLERRTGARPAGRTPAFTLKEHDSPLIWLGESITLPRGSGEWTVSRAENGRRVDMGRLPSGGRFTPDQAGSYVAISEGRARFFDVLAVEVQSVMIDESAAARRVSATVHFSPPLRAGIITRWEYLGPDGRMIRLEGPPSSLEGLGRHEFWPVIHIPGLAERRGPRPAVFNVSALAIRLPSPGRLRSGTPVPIEVAADPPLPDDTAYEWMRTDAAGKSETIVSKRAIAEIEFPAAGNYRLTVRAAGNVSPSAEVAAFRIALEGPDGRGLPEARLAVLEGKEVPTEAWIAKCPERFRIVVEDPSDDVPRQLIVSQPGWDVVHTLWPKGHMRATRPLVLLGDGDDNEFLKRDLDYPNLHAVPRERLMVSYRGQRIPVAEVGPMIVRDVPVRVVAVGSGFPSKGDLEKAINRRLQEASAVWAPFGRRFVRASLEIASPPRGLLLLRGRSAGVDVHGQSSRLGLRVDGVPVSVPTTWKSAPLPIARQLVSSLESSYRVDLFEKILPSDREAVVLRLRRRDGGAVSLERIHEMEDVSLSAELLEPALSEGCVVAAERSIVSLDEAAVLLGLRGAPSEGVDLFIVRRLRAEGDRTIFSKVYRSDDVPAPLAGAALAAWEIADGSGNYPYGLAQVLGLLLLPPGWSPRPEDTLFDPELSRAPSVNVQKRVGRLTGAKVREGGRVSGAENVDSTKGIEQGGR